MGRTRVLFNTIPYHLTSLLGVSSGGKGFLPVRVV